jgi:ABC-type nitrate/sulfonate/bicarbonate transport system substrate-binding protein
MVVRRGITEPKQTEGAKLALAKGTTATMLIERFIQKHRLDEKKIGLIHMSAPEQIPAFITGDIDGLISWEPWLWIAIQKSSSERDAEYSRVRVIGHDQDADVHHDRRPATVGDLQRMTDFLLKAGRIDQPVEVRKWLRPALLREIRPDLVKVSL